LNTSFQRQVYELMSSMRFAVSLLSVIAIASVTGTVLKQGEPYPNYVAQFGEFWFRLFETLGLYDVYHAVWFLLILAFLVASTSLCVYRNAPGMWKEIVSFREHATEASLRAFSHRAEYAYPGSSALERLRSYLAQQGFAYRESASEGPDGPRTLIAAKTGTHSRWGYILAHTAIVVICIGGLLDGNVPLKVQQLLGWKKVETRDIPQSQVPAQSRLGPSNPSFRGNVTVPEGSTVDVIFENVADGYLVQELPFTIQLKKFHIEHYTTGQPKAFASDVVVTDKQSGRQLAATIEVNKPLIFDGVAIYQASFSDGGTGLDLRAWDLFGGKATPVQMQGRINQVSHVRLNGTEYSLEFSDFRPFNIENFGPDPEATAGGAQSATAGRLPGLSSVPSKKDLRNVGPSFQYKLRNPQGQAREFTNYALAVPLDGRWYFMTGVRGAPNEPFRYMRIPGDENGAIDGYMRLKATLLDRSAHAEIARRFVDGALSGNAISETLRDKLYESTLKVLAIFADRGFEGVANFIERAVPQSEREKAADTYLKILDSAAYQALQVARQRAGVPPAPADENSARFVRDALNAISDSFSYGSPIYLQLASYDEVKASGLQLTRSPGKNLVYLGSVLLVLGVFAMFYIRERRIWLLVKPAAGTVLFAMSASRKTLDFEREFEKHRDACGALLKA
jgi:cytochrome c biogenesis protein